MRVFLCLLYFLFFSSCLCAQESLRYDYSSFDPCPDPAKYHIASRTVYVDRCSDSARTAAVDTLTEKFDRKGQLVAQTFFTAPTEFHGSASFGWQFVYDEQGRILRETDREDTSFYGTTYTYSADGKQAVIHHPPWRGDTITRFIYYDAQFAMEAEYLLNAAGDTLYQCITRGNVTRTISRYRDYEGLHIADSSICTRTPGYQTTFYDLHWREDCTMQEDVFYDAAGRMIGERSWLDGLLRDSIHYEYNTKGKLIRHTRIIFPRNYTPGDTAITTWHMEYFYDKKGRLVQDKNWSERDPNVVYYTHYTYNKKGLLTLQEETTVKNGKVEEGECERWVYGYWCGVTRYANFIFYSR